MNPLWLLTSLFFSETGFHLPKFLLKSLFDAFCADFVPIDLEEWWAQRFLANIANLS